MRDAEFQLVVAACKSCLDDRPLDPPQTNLRWDRYLALANRHRVQALCWHAIKPCADSVPSVVCQALQASARETIVSNLAAAAECGRLYELYKAAKLPILFVKGLTLATLGYRNPYLKMSMDIDLLIDPKRLAEAADLLRYAGYRPIFPADASNGELVRWHATRKESVWLSRQGQHQLDLHTRLADNPALLRDLNAHSRSQIVEVATGIALPTLANDELFAYLCVHGASSAWFRLKWITDLAALLLGKDPEEIERLYERSQRLDAGRSASQALLITDRLFEIGLGHRLRQQLAAGRTNRWLVQLAERMLLNPTEPTARPFGTAAIHLSQLGLLPGLKFKISETARQACIALPRNDR